MADTNIQEKKKRIKIAKTDKTSTKTKVRTQPKTVEEFFAARARDPNYFTINDKGDLIAPPVKDGKDIERVFTITPYRELTTKEKVDLDLVRRQTIAAAEEAVQEAQRELREKLLGYRNGDLYASDVVLANIEVMNKEKELQSKAWPNRQIDEIESIDTNKIRLDMPYEERKVPYPVFKFRHYPHTLQEQYVSETQAPEVEAEVPSEKQAQQVQQQPMTAADRGRLGGILKVRRKKI
jgi:hypothetical protein